ETRYFAVPSRHANIVTASMTRPIAVRRLVGKTSGFGSAGLSIASHRLSPVRLHTASHTHRAGIPQIEAKPDWRAKLACAGQSSVICMAPRDFASAPVATWNDHPSARV